MNPLLERLRGSLIVSVQAREGSALDAPEVLAAMALAAQHAGAGAVRMQGLPNLRAARRQVSLPIIGLVKRKYPGYEPYITPTLREVGEVLEGGAEIVAFDATERSRPEGVTLEDLVRAIRAGGAIAMADCATLADARAAQRAGAEILATTLCGYTRETAGRALPALDLLAEIAALGAFCICEGGVHEPGQASAALNAGAHAVVVGTAITGLEWIAGRFVAALARPR